MSAADLLFEDFIVKQLTLGGLSSRTISSYTDDDGMKIFHQAFTHQSANSSSNYEYLEFRGDAIVNMITVQYLQKRFPEVVSIQWLTKLKHNFSGKMSLADIAKDVNFDYWINSKGVQKSEKNIKYISMLEDVVEAFFGAIMIISKKKYSLGVGYAVCHNILGVYYDKKQVSLKWEDVFDSVTRIKEIYDDLGWDFDQNISTKFLRDKSSYSSIIWGYPKGDRTKNPENKDFISKGFAPTLEEARDKACLYAIRNLRQNYGIVEHIPSPYTTIKDSANPYIPAPPPTIPEGFKEFITKLLTYARVKKNVIDIMTQEEYLLDFRLSFIHDSYDSQVNYNLDKFEGVTVLDLIVVEYFNERFPDVRSEKWLTNMKHTLIGQKGKGELANISISSGFMDYILYGNEVKESLGKIEDVFKSPMYLRMLANVLKAFVGSLVKVFDKVRGVGVGIVVAYNFISYHLNKIDISVDYTDIFNYKSRLKELYDTYKWSLDKSITIVYDADAGEQVATIVGYPKGNRYRDTKNEVVLATARGRTKKEATQQASKIALEKLDRMYNIREKNPT